MGPGPPVGSEGREAAGLKEPCACSGKVADARGSGGRTSGATGCTELCEVCWEPKSKGAEEEGEAMAETGQGSPGGRRNPKSKKSKCSLVGRSAAGAAYDQAAGPRGSSGFSGPSASAALCVPRPKVGPDAAPSVFGPPPRAKAAPNGPPQAGAPSALPAPEVPAALMDSDVGAALTQQSNALTMLVSHFIAQGSEGSGDFGIGTPVHRPSPRKVRQRGKSSSRSSPPTEELSWWPWPSQVSSG